MKYIDPETLCLTQKEKEKLMNMLYRYEEAFILMDEIGTCPNIEVEIDVVGQTRSFKGGGQTDNE